MARTILTHGNAGVRCTDLHIDMRIANRIAHLLKRAARRKHSEGRSENQIARCGKACRNAHEVAFRNTRVKKLIGIGFFKHSGFGSRRQVGIHHD